jgi:hypothetical protein
MYVKLGLLSSLEHRLRVFENGVLRRIFGPKGDDVIGEWRKLYIEELTIYILHIRMMNSRIR